MIPGAHAPGYLSVGPSGLRRAGQLVTATVLALALTTLAAAQEKPATPEKASSAPPAARAFGGVGGIELSRAEAAQAVALVRHVFGLAESDASIQRMPTPEAVAHALTLRFKDAWPLKEPASPVFQEARPMQVFVTLYRANGTELGGEGAGDSLTEALSGAAAALAADARYRAGQFHRPAEVRVALDLTVTLVPYMANLAEPFLYSFRPGLDGLVYENVAQRSVTLPWEAVRRSWDLKFRRAESDKTGKPAEGDKAAPSGGADKTEKGDKTDKVEEFRPARSPEDIKAAVFAALVERAGTTMSAYRTPAARVLRFQSQSFVETALGGGDVLALYRTGPLVRAESLTEAEISTAVGLAADYLARSPNQDREVRDAYDPLRDQWQDDYSAARQAMTAAALAAQSRTAKQDWMLRAARTLSAEIVKGLRRQTLKTSGGQDFSCAYVGEAGRAELVRTAQVLACLATVEGVGPEEPTRAAIVELANSLLVSQQADGSFKVFFAPGTAADLVGKDAEDLRGESLSLLALALAYERTQSQELLAAARKTAEYLVFEREKKLGRKEPRGLADPYLVEALAILDGLLVNDAFVSYAAGCAAAIREKQIVDATQAHRDELGGFRLIASYPDAEYSSFCLRGLRAMERLADRIETAAATRFTKLGLAATRDRARESARQAEAFLVGLQYTPANLFYAATAPIAAGGLRQSAYDTRVSTIAVCNFLLAESK